MSVLHTSSTAEDIRQKWIHQSKEGDFEPHKDHNNEICRWPAWRVVGTSLPTTRRTGPRMRGGVIKLAYCCINPTRRNDHYARVASNGRLHTTEPRTAHRDVR